MDDNESSLSLEEKKIRDEMEQQKYFDQLTKELLNKVGEEVKSKILLKKHYKADELIKLYEQEVYREQKRVEKELLDRGIYIMKDGKAVLKSMPTRENTDIFKKFLKLF